MIRLLRRLFSIVAFVGVGAYLLTGAIDDELASGALTERAEVGGVEGASGKPAGIGNGIAGQEVGLAASARSVSACGASSIGPDGRVTVTSCGERLSERDLRTEIRRLAEEVPHDGRTARQQDRPSARSESLYQGKQASIRAIRRVFGRRAPAAIRVASCETGGTFYARSVGRAGERGLFQIHPIHFSWAQPARLFDPVWNSRVAYRLSRGGTNWRPWSCRWAA